MSQEIFKQQAAIKAVEQVQSNMVVGLGTGSTSAYAITRIGERLKTGEIKNIVGVPTSEKTKQLALLQGIPLRDLQDVSQIDLALDGADEFDAELNLIKGLGGALLREKAVEQRAARFVVMVDHSKWVKKLGTKAPVPVEIRTSEWAAIKIKLSALDCTPILRAAPQPFVTDNGNYILDCHFSQGISAPSTLANQLDGIQGVLAHGLFIHLAKQAIMAGPEGIRIFTSP